MSLRDRIGARARRIMPRVSLPDRPAVARLADRALTEFVEVAVVAADRWGSARTRISRAYQARARESVSSALTKAGDGDAVNGRFRRITQRRDTRLTPMARDRLIKLASLMYQANATVRLGLNIATAYVIGQGFRVVADDERVQQVLDGHWFHKLNDWPGQQAMRARLLAMYGSLALPRFTAPDGTTVLGYLSPERIDDVINDPENDAIVIGVEQRRRRLKRVAWRTILSDDERVMLSAEAQRMRAKYDGGDLFIANVNQVEPGELGVPDGSPGFDAADAMDQLYEEVLVGVQYQNNAPWDVTLKGNPTQAEIDQLCKGRLAHPPAPGEPNVHGENEVWTALSPDLRAQAWQDVVNMYLANVARALGVPPHWLADPGDVNRATALASDAPVIRLLTERQRYFGSFVSTILDDQLAVAVQAGRLPSSVLDDRAAYTLEASQIADARGDVTAKAASLAGVQVALQGAVAAGHMTDETAVRVWAAVVRAATGVEIDAADEEAKLAEFRAARAKTPPPSMADEYERGNVLDLDTGGAG